jgi:hypothetical protein
MLAVKIKQRDDIDNLLDDVFSSSISAPAKWQPDPRNAPQCLAYQLATQVDEMGYGGQAGGGKSDLALGLASTLFNRSLMLREQFVNFRRLIERGNEIFPTTFVGGNKNEWRFGGRVITLGHVQHEKDWKKYQGWDSELLAVDEAAECPELAVRKISGWLRSSKGHHTLLLYLFNPPTTPEGQWIVKKFAPWIDPEYPGTPAQSGEVRYFVQVDDDNELEVESAAPYTHKGETYLPIRRVFIKASRFDNPYLDAEYERRINSLPEPLRTQVRDGDFTVGMKDDDWQVIPTNWILAAQKRWQDMEKPNLRMSALGMDVAHGGADRTTIARLFGNWFDLHTYPGEETPEGKDAAQKAHLLIENECSIYVDAIGYGASAHEELKNHYGYKQAVAFNVGEGSTATDESGQFGFSNKRAEMHWKLREALNPASGNDLAIPPGQRLRVELSTPRYSVVGGRYKIESKEDIKERLGRSPDEAEALMIAWHAANTRPQHARNIPLAKNAGRRGH